MALLTTLIVKNRNILVGNYFIFLKKTTQTKLERLLIPSLDLSEKIGKVVIKDCRTIPRPDSSPTDTFPRTAPRLTFPRGTYPRPDNSPAEHFPDGDFPDRTFPQLDIFPTITNFNFFALLAKLSVKAIGLDFPLFFSWFIILSTHFIYTQLIYKRLILSTHFFYTQLIYKRLILSTHFFYRQLIYKRLILSTHFFYTRLIYKRF